MLRRVVELGVNLIDTADSYGPDGERAAHRRGAASRTPTTSSSPPRAACAERAEPVEPRRSARAPHAGVRREPAAACGSSRSRCTSSTGPTPRCRSTIRIGALVELKDEGKIRHIGLSNVDEDQLARALAMTPIVSVQNRYDVRDRRSESMLDLCEQEQIAFLPYSPVQDFEGHAAVQESAAPATASP